jgi:hypothetical protein
MPPTRLRRDSQFLIPYFSSETRNPKLEILNVVGVTGIEPVTLRLSSACSNQLSYTPDAALTAAIPNSR